MKAGRSMVVDGTRYTAVQSATHCDCNSCVASTIGLPFSAIELRKQRLKVCGRAGLCGYTFLVLDNPEDYQI